MFNNMMKGDDKLAKIILYIFSSNIYHRIEKKKKEQYLASTDKKRGDG